MGVYEDRVKRLHEHVIAQEKKNVPTNKEIIAMLEAKGIEYDPRANKETLLKLLEGAE